MAKNEWERRLHDCATDATREVEQPPASENHSRSLVSPASWRARSVRWERYLALSHLVRTAVIPRLVMAHPTFVPDGPTSPSRLTDADIADFVQLAIAHDPIPFLDHFDRALARGHSADRLFLDLLAPAACLLGRLWDEDLCTFVDVTLGLARLQALVSGAPANQPDAVDDRRHVFLTGAPGEQHTLGLAMVEHFMRDAGWLITSSPASTVEELREVLEHEWFAVIGLALSDETRIEQLAAAILAVRTWSFNKSIGVMVGGPIFLLRPELTSYVGADASAVDRPTAVMLAQKLLHVQEARGPK